MESPEERLTTLMASLRHDPLSFVKASYQWGEGELSDSPGPRSWQAEILDEIGAHLRNPATRYAPHLIAVASGHSIGKGHPYGLVVPTPTGMARWGDLNVGDSVFGADGQATRIKDCFHHKKVPTYLITFDDGSSTEAWGNHLWNVRGRHERRHGLDSWRTLTTEELMKAGLFRKNGRSLTRQWEIPTQGTPEFEPREIDVHPYLLGVWIGDGTRGKPEFNKPYPEIADKVRSLGYMVDSKKNGVQRIKNSDLNMTDIYNLHSYERYIPDEYKFNSAINRMALLEGLCDTDGEVHQSGSIGYSTTSKRLADDVVWLARSLGCKAKIQDAIKAGWYYDTDGKKVECRDCWRITINAPFNPFTLKHRKERYKPSIRRYATRWIDKIERITDSDGMCIMVEAKDSLYQANDFIVTHNSSLISMICNWALSTCADTKIVVTANTATQLATKTWPEMDKWTRSSITAHWFKTTATAISAKDNDHERTWRADAIPWSETNTEAFAGLHNKGRRIVLIFDESSAIADKVWEVAEGALTDENTEIIWLAFGNPTRNTGRFKECFGRYRHRWNCRQIDSRNVEGINKELIDHWIKDYGEDSDFVKVRVKGEFPRAGSMQFISSDLVDAARKREPYATNSDPLVMGVDVARYGDDQSVIVFRRGRDAVTIPWVTYRNVDTMTLSARIVDLATQYRPDAIFVDGGGVGGGVIDRLRMLRQPVIEVQFGGAADRATVTGEGAVVYANKRAEMWGTLRDWLKGGSIPDNPELAADLTGVEYGYIIRDGRDAILLEKKADMKKRGLASPDQADALAISLAYPVAPSLHYLNPNIKSGHSTDYDPLSPTYIQQDYNPLARR